MRQLAPIWILCTLVVMRASFLTAAVSDDESFRKLWFRGSVEQAFAAAGKQKKPLFLYWGAVWCPPCNELKARVFTQPRFASLVKDIVPVYLDGDTAEAQSWGERLGVSGYPTLLLFNAQGEEILRLGESLTLDEFEEAARAALGLNLSLEQSLTAALSGHAKAAQWRTLALGRWEESGRSAAGPRGADEILAIRWDLARQVPPAMVEERAIFAAALLTQMAKLTNDGPQTKLRQSVSEQVAHATPRLFEAMLRDGKAIVAARSTLIYDTQPVLSWARQHLSPTEFRHQTLQWSAAAELLRTNESLSIDTRLWAVYPQLSIYRLMKGGKAPIPERMQRAIAAAVQLADQQAKTPFERQAVISGAAHLLREVGDMAGAEKLLVAELGKTSSPWYYELALAHLAEEAGRASEALQWSKQARQSATGQATRLQWLVNDLLLVVKLRPTARAEIAELLAEYYELALELPDGFLGRNQVRAQQVVAAVGALLPDKQLLTTVARYAPRCGSLRSERRGPCQQHFNALLDENKLVL